MKPEPQYSPATNARIAARIAKVVARSGTDNYAGMTTRWVEPWSLKERPPGYKPTRRSHHTKRVRDGGPG